MISNPSSFINTLKEFGKRIHKVTKRQIDNVVDRINNKEFEFDRMYDISKSAYNLLLWLKAMVKLYHVFKQVPYGCLCRPGILSCMELVFGAVGPGPAASCLQSNTRLLVVLDRNEAPSDAVVGGVCV